MKPLLLIAPLTLLAACSGTPDEDEAGKKEEPVALVRLAVAGQGSTTSGTPLYGLVEPTAGAETSLVAPAETVVARILAPNGTVVAAGAPILALTPNRAVAGDLAKAQADVAASSAAYARAQRMRAQGLVSDADVESARAAAQGAQSQLARLGIAPGGLTLRAPRGGVVQRLSAHVGDQVAAGTVLASVVSGRDLQARFGLDPALAQGIHPGQRLMLGEPAIPLTVSGVDSLPDPASRQVSLYARLPSGAGLAPGQAVSATLMADKGGQGVSVPYAALLDDGGKSYVFVVRGGVAHRQDVLPGNSSGETILIRQGVRPGDRLVVEGASALDDGMKVRER